MPNNLENILSKTDKRVMAELLSKIVRNTDDTPWLDWIDKNFCQKCETITKCDDKGFPDEYSFCESEGYCPHGLYLIPEVDLIERWLDQEVTDDLL